MRAWGDGPGPCPEWRTEPWLALLTLIALAALVGALGEAKDAQAALQAAQWRIEILEEHSYAHCNRVYPQSWDPPGREIVYLDCPAETTP